eukprot:m.10994 g.10994  ORF g.10994 m.10994 type:complete len:111 (+) comp6789_c0_seq2:142-474(+)
MLSISSVQLPKLVQKMFQAILLTGNGSRYRELAPLLRQRLHSRIPFVWSRLIEDVVVEHDSKDMDPAHLAWKGGAVLAQLPSVEGVWIERKEWEVKGTRVLREKGLFQWM